MYDNALDTNYEELRSYYPVWYREVFEMDALWRVFGKQLDGIRDSIIATIDNNFIWTANEEIISRLEDFLYITYDGIRELEDRKMMVASYFLGNGHIGEKEIKETVSAFTESPCSVSLIGGTISLAIMRDLEDRFILSDCYFILLKKIPAHLGLEIVISSPFETDLYAGVIVSRYSQQTISQEGVST